MYKINVNYIKLLQKKDNCLKLILGHIKARGGSLQMMYYIFGFLMFFNLAYFVLNSLTDLVF